MNRGKHDVDEKAGQGIPAGGPAGNEVAGHGLQHLHRQQARSPAMTDEGR
jgi:hypothetical protein